MLTGRRLFEGETISHVLAAVLTREPDVAVVPMRVRHLVSRCLEKDPRKRLRDIGDAMSLVRGPEDPSTSAGGASGVSRSRVWLTSGAWVALGTVAGALAVMGLRPTLAGGTDPPLVRFQIERPADIYNNTATAFAVSPDGRMLAYYGAGDNSQFVLLVRTLTSNEVREVPESTTFSPRAHSLFWSPDSQHLVSVVGTSAHVFDATTGATRTLCECRFVGGTWNRDGVILLGAAGNVAEGIRRLSPGDRIPIPVTTVGVSQGESDRWPVFLPDGRHFLFTRSSPGVGLAT
jgi:serine/threonine-protein kinase